jgi:iron(III) transport system permease protein
VRAIWNTILIGTVGGTVAVMCYPSLRRIAGDGWSRFVDYLVLVPHSGLLAGLAFLGCFFLPTAAAVAHDDLQHVAPIPWCGWPAACAHLSRQADAGLEELEEAARTVGATRGQISRQITLPLIRPGLIASWLLVFMIFEREYSTGVYLLAPGTEVIGAQLVSLWQGGAIDVVAALSLINVVLVGVGLALALRFGVKLRD